MDGDDSITEDEWTCMRRRFSIEGLEWETQDSNTRTLQVWRLVVDAEANLKAVRHINDKLRRQHDQEKEELEEYTEHLRQKCEERVKELDDEVKTLREDLEALLAGTQAVGTMLLNEGLDDVAQSTLGEQIAYLLVERAKLNEELVAARTKPASDREKELTTQLIKVSTDYELLKRTHKEAEEKLTEMTDRVSLLEKASRQLEVDNETLAYKLSEALAEIEDNENQLRLYSKNTNFRRGESPRVSLRSQEDHGPPSLRSLPLADTAFIRRDSQRRSGRRGESPRSSSRQRKMEPVKSERTKSTMKSHSRPRRSSRAGSFRQEEGEQLEGNFSEAVDGGLHSRDASFDIADSRRNSIMSHGSASPKKIYSLLDGQIHTARHQIGMLDEVKQLQTELETVKKDLLGAGDKYEYILRKYELYKIKCKSKVSSIKSNYETELENAKRLNSSLEAQVALQSDQLRSDEALRKQLEKDLADIRSERQEMAIRVREIERELQKRDQEISLLQEKVKLIQERNQQLNNKLQELSVAAIVG